MCGDPAAVDVLAAMVVAALVVATDVAELVVLL